MTSDLLVSLCDLYFPTVARYSKSDIPDSLSPELPVDLPTLQEPEVAYVGYIIDSGKKEVVLEPQSNVR